MGVAVKHSMLISLRNSTLLKGSDQIQAGILRGDLEKLLFVFEKEMPDHVHGQQRRLGVVTAGGGRCGAGTPGLCWW